MREYNDKKNKQLQELLGTTSKKSIYHYTSIEALKSILEKKTLWLSDISFMNDESEIKYTFDLVCEYLDSVKKYDGEFKDFIKKGLNNIKNGYNNEMRYNYYVISFSLNPDSLPIWVYYTKNSNSAGFNIEFDKRDITSLIKNHSMMHGCLSGLVIYNKTKQKAAIRNILNKYFNMYKESPEEEAWNAPKKASILSAFSDLLLLSLFLKSSYFKNEEEFRIVIPVLQIKDNQYIDLNFRISNGMLIPYVEVSFKENQDVVKGITISPTLKSNLVEKGLKDFVIAQKYKNLEQNITRSKIPLRY